MLRPEETIATKAYVANRDRFDGADILHIIHALQGEVDWRRTEDLLGGDEEILLWHLVLFAFVYPMHRDWLPRELLRRAFERDGPRPRSSAPSAFRGACSTPSRSPRMPPSGATVTRARTHRCSTAREASQRVAAVADPLRRSGAHEMEFRTEV
jgi:hypothetical protein